MADRLISADALRQEVESRIYWNMSRGVSFLESIDAAPTVDAVPVVHGRWECLESEIGYYACSECDHRILRAKCNYCPNCGAKMDGGENRNAENIKLD